MDRELVTQFGAGREIVARGLGRMAWRDAYHRLLTMPWWRFFALVFVGYLAINALFATGYFALGDAIENADGSFSDAFFFSVQTLATIGYGKMAPRTLAGNLLVTTEALLGMMGLAVTTGLVFARFSRPTARVLFSRVAVIGPYEGVPSLQFRMANARGNRIVEARLHLTLVRDEVTAEGAAVRRLRDLRLVRSEHQAFALTWTAVHPIDEASPLHGQTAADLDRGLSELLVSLTGIDEGFAQTVHARYAYGAGDLRWDARFADILTPGRDRSIIEFRKFHDTVPLGPASASERASAPVLNAPSASSGGAP